MNNVAIKTSLCTYKKNKDLFIFDQKCIPHVYIMHVNPPHSLHIHFSRNSKITIARNNWILSHFANNYVREKYTDRREYYAGLRREWEYRYNESNTLHIDLVVLGAPLPDRVSLTMPRSNVVDYEKVMKQILKENNLMLLCRCHYYMLQLAEEMATAT